MTTRFRFSAEHPYFWSIVIAPTINAHVKSQLKKFFFKIKLTKVDHVGFAINFKTFIYVMSVVFSTILLANLNFSACNQHFSNQ